MTDLERKLTETLASHIDPAAGIGLVVPCRMGADAGFVVTCGSVIFFVRERFGKLEKTAAWSASALSGVEIKPGFMGNELRARHEGREIRLSRLSEQDAAALGDLLGCRTVRPEPVKAGRLSDLEQHQDTQPAASEDQQEIAAVQQEPLSVPPETSAPPGPLAASRIPPWKQGIVSVAADAAANDAAEDLHDEAPERAADLPETDAGSSVGEPGNAVETTSSILEPAAQPAQSGEGASSPPPKQAEAKPPANPSDPPLGLGLWGVVVRALLAGGLSGFFLYSMIEGVEHKYGLDMDDWLDLPKILRGPLLWVVMAVIGPLVLPHFGRLVRMIPWGLAAAIVVALIRRKPYEMEFYGAEFWAWIFIASGYLRTRKVELWYILGPLAAVLILPASTCIPKAMFGHMSDPETGITLGILCSIFWFVLFVAEIDKPEKD